MDFLLEALNRSLKAEGGFTDNRSDSGGPTNYGVTEALARRYGYTGDMKDLDRRTAISIHTAEFWQPLNCQALCDRNPLFGYKIFDIGMNMGPDRAATFLQRLINVLNRQGKDYADIEVDGQIGPKTLGALDAFLNKRGSDGHVVILRGLNDLQGAFYITLAEARQKDEDFMFGWLLNRVQ